LARKKAKSISTIWDVSGQSFPVKIYIEWRRSRRVSIGKKEIIVRLPWIEKQIHLEECVQWAREWLEAQYNKRPEIFDHLLQKSYQDGDVIHTHKKSYPLKITQESRKTGAARYEDEVIKIKLPNHLDQEQQGQMVSTLLGRILAQDNQPWVDQRVRWLNDHYIKENIKSVQLKNNRSNWGSCSSSGNINISVRLLFAPEDVQDYVLIHELAHLKELNHSDRFWKIVRDIMPDYKEKEKWLKENGSKCNF